MKPKYNRIFVDFDDTLTNSLESMCRIYNKKYSTKVNWRDIRRWSAKDKCEFLKDGELLEIFSSDEFFDGLTIKDNCIETLNHLSKIIPISIVTIGSVKNCVLKQQYIKENFKFIDKTHFIVQNENIVMNKSSVDMTNGIFVDDVSSNLKSSNARRKILFETIPGAEWNNDWRGTKISDWKQFCEFI